VYTVLAESNVAQPHHFYAAPFKGFDAAPAPTLQRTKVNIRVGALLFQIYCISLKYHVREKYNSREKYSARTFDGKLRHFKSSFLVKQSYGFEVECINNIREKKNSQICHF
jgi:hypothetical protein